MNLFSAKEMREIEKKIMSRLKTNEDELILRAAIALLLEIKNQFTSLDGKTAAIFCGGGNNGADGLCLASRLIESGAQVHILLQKEEEALSPAGKRFLAEAKDKGAAVVLPGSLSAIFDIEFDFFVDALCGIGFHGESSGYLKELIDYINEKSPYTISADLPSGCDSSTGEVSASAVKADLTVTFIAKKIGHEVYPMKGQLGTLKVDDLGVSGEELMVKTPIILTEFDDVKDVLPKIKDDSHKGDFGKLLIVGSSLGLEGGSVMAANAAVRSGAGRVNCAVPSRVQQVVATKITEATAFGVASDEKGAFKKDAIEDIAPYLEIADAVLLGCAMGRGTGGQITASEIVRRSKKPILIDADGINNLIYNINIIKEASCPIVMTPHMGEMSRLTGFTIAEIKRRPLKTATEFASEYGVTLLLKGHRTIIASPGGQVYINPTGNVGMATAGSGDVLAGIIASFMAQGVDVYMSAVLGAYVHGLSGDFAAKKFGKRATSACDIIDNLYLALKLFEKEDDF